MEQETVNKIREWEKERDRNIRIHCTHVAAKFQRWIDKELEHEQKSQENDHRNSKEDNQKA